MSGSEGLWRVKVADAFEMTIIKAHLDLRFMGV